jgi:hypothetical protein
MEPAKAQLLEALRRELQFLDRGGYAAPVGWRPALIFEDSPTCLGKPDADCGGSGCPLLQLVPAQIREELRDQPALCRHIPLSDRGETVDILYKTATHAELESTLRTWLTAQIKRLEE